MRKIHFDLLAPVYDRVIKARKPRALLKGIDRYIPENGSYRILEVGGGTGRLAQFLTGERAMVEDDVQSRLERTKNEVVVLDPSEKMLRRAEKRGLMTVRGYAEELPFEDGSFDLVVATDSLHHWRHHDRALEEVRRVLRPGGVLAVEEINPKRRIGKMVMVFEKMSLMGSRFFRPEALEEMVSRAGLAVREVREFDKPVYQLFATRSSGKSVKG